MLCQTDKRSAVLAHLWPRDICVCPQLFMRLRFKSTKCIVTVQLKSKKKIPIELGLVNLLFARFTMKIRLSRLQTKKGLREQHRTQSRRQVGLVCLAP